MNTEKKDSITALSCGVPALENDCVIFNFLRNCRNAYNIWVPSPNRIENLRIILQYASERIARNDLFRFICEEFKLKASSVDSMLPFLKASGLLEEVGRNVYIATPAAKAWLETGNDLDFVRILHANMRFVGEMIRAANEDIVRNEIYAQAKQHGLNAEKARWITGFLLEAGLLEEPQYLHLKATHVGRQFVLGLPLVNAEGLDDATLKSDGSDMKANVVSPVQEESEQLTARLHNTARDPYAEGKTSGVAFEEAIAEIFNFMGFNAKRIGGSGDTDVVVCWKDKDTVAILYVGASLFCWSSSPTAIRCAGFAVGFGCRLENWCI